MPICIECQHPVKTLWTEYSGAGDKSSGHNIRLTVCRNCGHFCDKYVEHDFVVIFIDLVLIKPQVYRHLLHNTLMREGDQFDPSIVRLGVLLLLFDVYLTWARIEKQSNPEDVAAAAAAVAATAENYVDAEVVTGMVSSLANPASRANVAGPSFPQTAAAAIAAAASSSYTSAPFMSNAVATGGAGAGTFGRLAQQPIVFQYVFFLVLCALSTLAFHLAIRFLTSSPLSPLVRLRLLPRFPRPNSVSTALLVSSSTKLFPILMVIWDYDVPAAARSLGWAVVVNNIEALKILLDCGYGVAGFLAMAGACSRWAIGRLVLWAAGLGDVDGAGESSVADDGRALWAVVLMVRDWAGRLAVG
ncbi:Arv1 protein [Niveomyces insectorum RCEF 264]|uniref:Protein ARV n=1 Tax=Niveomyces insectorum RCEF 264 TaxID=1081102 RepID=A0A167QWR2_9HYPO|nr:Arv1 protein [Niveomyces insectorum RCEF 264]